MAPHDDDSSPCPPRHDDDTASTAPSLPWYDDIDTLVDAQRANAQQVDSSVRALLNLISNAEDDESTSSNKVLMPAIRSSSDSRQLSERCRRNLERMILLYF